MSQLIDRAKDVRKRLRESSRIAKMGEIAGESGSGDLSKRLMEAADIIKRLCEAMKMEWQPIETAPKDHTELIAGWWHTADEDEPATEPVWKWYKSSYEVYPDRRGFRHRNGACLATHWMLPPEPPAPQAQDGLTWSKNDLVGSGGISFGWPEETTPAT